MPADRSYHNARAATEQAMAAAAGTLTARIVHQKLARLHRDSADRPIEATLEPAAF